MFLLLSYNVLSSLSNPPLILPICISCSIILVSTHNFLIWKFEFPFIMHATLNFVLTTLENSVPLIGITHLRQSVAQNNTWYQHDWYIGHIIWIMWASSPIQIIQICGYNPLNSPIVFTISLNLLLLKAMAFPLVLAPSKPHQ